jgi:hypothetical protein
MVGLVDRVALALRSTLHLATREEREASYRAARAAIAAMREPDKRIVEAGIQAAEDVEDWTRDSHDRYRVDVPSDMVMPVWRAMIDAALTRD